MGCKDCIFKAEVRQGHEIRPQMVCRRFPPVSHPVSAQGGIGLMTFHPVVDPESVCGEYIPGDGVMPEKGAPDKFKIVT